jgi:hypothetical protein
MSQMALVRRRIVGNSGLTGTMPELLYNLADPGPLVVDAIGSNVDTTVPPPERECSDGLLRYLPHLYRSKAKQIDRVTEVKCSNVAVGASIPSAIGLYTALTRLELSRAGMTGTLPTEIGLLTDLVDVHMATNAGLSGSLPTQFGAMSRLRDVYLNDNAGLTGTLPSQLGNWYDVRRLNLENNLGLVGTVPEAVYALTAPGKLNELVIAGTGLALEEPTTPRSCTDGLQLYLPHLYRSKANQIDQVTEVQCSSEAVQSFIPRSIGLYTGLTRLNLQSARVTGTLPTEIGLLSNLQYLTLEDNAGLTGTLPTQWNRMSGLTYLDLGGNSGLSGPLPVAWEGMNSLATL